MLNISICRFHQWASNTRPTSGYQDNVWGCSSDRTCSFDPHSTAWTHRLDDRSHSWVQGCCNKMAPLSSAVDYTQMVDACKMIPHQRPGPGRRKMVSEPNKTTDGWNSWTESRTPPSQPDSLVQASNRFSRKRNPENDADCRHRAEPQSWPSKDCTKIDLGGSNSPPWAWSWFYSFQRRRDSRHRCSGCPSCIPWCLRAGISEHCPRLRRSSVVGRRTHGPGHGLPRWLDGTRSSYCWIVSNSLMSCSNYSSTPRSSPRSVWGRPGRRKWPGCFGSAWVLSSEIRSLPSWLKFLGWM